MGTELTKPEAVRLEECEQTIRAGLATFTDVGNALLEIRDQRLYRVTHKTFEAYCQSKWKMTRMRASQLINAASADANVNHGLQKPTSERQLRPLTRLEPEKQAQAWEMAVQKSGGEPTAKDVEEAVEEINDKNIGIFGKPTISESSPEDNWTENVMVLVSYWKKSTKAEKQMFCEAVNLTQK